MFLPNSVSVSVPCQCILKNLDPFAGCCPNGFFMLEDLVYNDVGLLTTLLRRERLNPTVRPDHGAADPQTFYDTSVFPDRASSTMPARRWCTPMPGVYEDSWMQETPASLTCAGEGFASDRGVRRLVIGASPPKFVPQTCAQLDVQGVQEGWTSVPYEVWHTYPNKVFLSDPLDVTTSARRYEGAGGENRASAEACRGLCSSDDCTGVTVKYHGDGALSCYVSNANFVGNPQLNLPMVTFESFRKQRLAGVCEYPSSGVQCVLGTTAYGTLPLCRDLKLVDTLSEVETQLPAARAALNATQQNRNKGTLYAAWQTTKGTLTQTIADAKQPFLDIQTRLGRCKQNLNAEHCDGDWADDLQFVQTAWNEYDEWQGKQLSATVADTELQAAKGGLSSALDDAESFLPKRRRLIEDPADNEEENDDTDNDDTQAEDGDDDDAAGGDSDAINFKVERGKCMADADDCAVIVNAMTDTEAQQTLESAIQKVKDKQQALDDVANGFSLVQITTTFEAKTQALRSATDTGMQQMTNNYLSPLHTCQQSLDCADLENSAVQTAAEAVAGARADFEAAPAGIMCAEDAYCTQTDVDAAQVTVNDWQAQLDLLGVSPTFDNLGTECLARDTSEDAFEPRTGMDCFPAAGGTAEVKIDLDTATPQQYAPAADAVVFGAHRNNNDFAVSVATVPPLLGGMRPENPCATLSTPDMFWGTETGSDVDRTKCQSALDPDLTCDIREYKGPPCINVQMSGRAAEHLHSAMLSDAVLPHKLTVSGLGDLEVSLFRTRFEYRVALSAFDPTTLRQTLQTYLDNKDTVISTKQGEIATIQNSIVSNPNSGKHILTGGEVDFSFPSNMECKSSRCANNHDNCANYNNAYTLFQEMVCGRNMNPTDHNGGLTPRTTMTGDISGWSPHCCGYGGACEYNNGNGNCNQLGLKQTELIAQKIKDHVETKFDEVVRNTPYEYYVASEETSSDNENSFAWSNWDSDLVGTTVTFDSLAAFECAKDHVFCNPSAKAATLTHAFDKCYIGYNPRFAPSPSEIDGRETVFVDTQNYGVTAEESLALHLGMERHANVCPSTCHFVEGNPRSTSNPGEKCHRCARAHQHGQPCTYDGFVGELGAFCTYGDCNTGEIEKYVTALKATAPYAPDRTGAARGEGLMQRAEQALAAATKALKSKRDQITPLEGEIATLEQDKTTETQRVNGLIAQGTTDLTKASCTPDFPCDLCEGHCESDAECRGTDLKCSNTNTNTFVTYCQGTPNTEFAYCLPSTDEWTATGAELYIAGAVTATAHLSTWLLEVENYHVVKTHARTEHAYVFSDTTGAETCNSGQPTEQPCTSFMRPLCSYDTCTRVPMNEAGAGVTHVLNGTMADGSTNRVELSALFTVQSEGTTYYGGIRQNAVNSVTFVQGWHDACFLYSYPVTTRNTTTGNVVTRVYVGYQRQVVHCTSHSIGDYINPLGESQLYGVDMNTLWTNDMYQPTRYEYDWNADTADAFGKDVRCLWWERGKYHVMEGDGSVWVFERGDDTAVRVTSEHTATLTSPHTSLHPPTTFPVSLTPNDCPDSSPWTADTALGDFDIQASAVSLNGLQRETLVAMRATTNLFTGSTSADEITGMVMLDGVAGTNLQYAHAPWVVAPNHPRALSARTSEECGLLCETTYGCTSFLFQGGGGGQDHHSCWLFTFDPSTTGCDIFDAVDTSAFPEGVDRGGTPAAEHLPLAVCESDCDYDRDCAGTLRCFERDNKEPVPGCRNTDTISATHDFCYDPFQSISGVAAIRRPNACGLCKSRGLLPVVDIARLGLMLGPSQNQRGRNVECYTQAYSPARDASDTAETWVAQSCRLFPWNGDWAADGGTTVPHRCPPTRAGVHTKFYSSTQHVGMQFASDPAHAPTVLHGHPNLLTHSECQTACVDTQDCVAWQFDEETVASPTQIAVETTDAYRARVQVASSLIVDDEHCSYVVDPDITESGKSAPTEGTWYASRLPATSVYYSDNAVTECATRCLHTRGASAFYVFHERCKCSRTHRDPQCTTRTPNSATASYSIIRDPAKLGTHCERCNAQSPYDQCSGNGVCFTSTVVNTVPGCLGDVPGLSYCVPKPLLEHTCSLYRGEAPEIAPATTSQVFDGAHRIGFVERDHTPKTALMDDGANHPACACYNEEDTSYNCACEAGNRAPFQNDISNAKFGCSGHGQCSSLEYACICDLGYSWAWQAADSGQGLPAGFTCVACPAGTFRDASVPTCTACPRGTYQPNAAQATCDACPTDQTTLQTMSSAATDCVAI